MRRTSWVSVLVIFSLLATGCEGLPAMNVGEDLQQTNTTEVTTRNEAIYSTEQLVTEEQEETQIEEVVVDVTPPTIEGTADIMVTQGETVSYRRNVVVTDDVDAAVPLQVDNSAVDLNTPGNYPVVYSAVDAAGNEASVEIVLTVLAPDAPTEEEANALADEVIAQVVTADMSQYDQAFALWQWCRRNMRYSYSAGDRTTIWTGAYEGFTNRTGDCYVYFATYALLLTRCGIENMTVTRVGGTSNHWWNLVNTGSGWYHCDCSPRSNDHPYRCFMQTDAQVQAYTESYPEHPNYYTFDASLYPERAETIIYGD